MAILFSNPLILVVVTANVCGAYNDALSMSPEFDRHEALLTLTAFVSKALR